MTVWREPEWTSGIWEQALVKVAAATNLTIQLFSGSAVPVVGPVNPTPLFRLFTAADDGLVAACIRRGLADGRPVVETRHGISVCGAPILYEGNAVGVAVAGYALTAYPNQITVRRLATQTGHTFDALWSAIRKTVPIPAGRLMVYAELLQSFGESLLAEHVSGQTARAALQVAETANRAKDDFLAMLAHELRNPLSAVKNAVMTARCDETRRDPALEIARRQTDQLTRLIDDLLEVARITQGRITLRKERVCLAKLLEVAVDATRPLVDERRHTLTLLLPADPLQVEADPARLEQVIVNLLTNAAKYTPVGGRIELAAAREDDHAIVRVRDTGKGIAPDMLLRVFDLFTQGPQTLDRTEGGLGIGLTLVKRLVELHGGQVEAHSKGIDQGTEVIVRLPALPAGLEEPAHERPEEPPAARRARLLLVEDNPDAAESMRLLLEFLGHRVRVVHDGLTALEVARGDVPDMMLVDVGLPGINGYDLARRVRELPELKDTVLVAVTGYGREQDRGRAFEAGFRYHLVKPVDPDLLGRLVAGFGKNSPANEPTVH